MAKRRKSLLDLLKERLTILLTADDDLVDDIKSTEKSIFSTVLSFLRRLSQKDGRLVNEEDSVRQMAKIRRALRKVVRESTIDKKIEAFIPNFEKVDRFTRDIYGDILGGDVDIPDIDAYRALAIDQLISAFDENKGLDSSYIIPLQKRIFEAIQLEMPVNEAINYIRPFVVGTTDSGGNLASYSRTIATDLINGYSAFADYQIAKANGMDGFFFSGSLINTSRQTCIDMVNGSGEFEEIAIEPGLFAIEDVDKIVVIGRDNPGWRPETTVETYFILRNGYNCRHFLVFTFLTDGDKEKAARKRIKSAIERLKNFKPDR